MIKEFFKKLFCLHSVWEKSIIWKHSPSWMFYYYQEYTCIGCNKRKLFKKDHPPINFYEYPRSKRDN